MRIIQLKLAQGDNHTGLWVSDDWRTSHKDREACERAIKAGNMSVEAHPETDGLGYPAADGWRILRTCYGDAVWLAQIEGEKK